LRAPTAEPSYRASLASFFAAVATGRPASPDLGEGLRALEIADAAVRSAAEARRTAIADRSTAAVSPLGH
jgi:predicted dehydrogenase